MKLVLSSIILLCIILLASCASNNEKKIILTQPNIIHLDNLSSASGIGIYNKVNYIVGDDTPWLYELDNNLQIISKTQITPNNNQFKGRTPKKLKSDFEAAEIIIDDQHVKLIVISSGSKKTTRDTTFVINILDNSKVISKDMRPLFDDIKKVANLPATNKINIEGIAVSENNVFLFHRGNVSENIVVKIGRSSFMHYLNSESTIPKFDIFRFNLPEYKGVASGFSGACVNHDNTGLLFTASMEDTNDEVNDGAVLGSFVGTIPFSGLKEGEFTASLLMKNNIILEKKLEGIAISSVDKNGEIKVVTVCDNDDGTSDIIKFGIMVE